MLKTHLFGTGIAGAKKEYVPGFFKACPWKSKMKKIVTYRLLGYIAYGVHLCNNILIFQVKPKNAPAQEMWLISLLPVPGQEAGAVLHSKSEYCFLGLSLKVLPEPPFDILMAFTLGGFSWGPQPSHQMFIEMSLISHYLFLSFRPNPPTF